MLSSATHFGRPDARVISVRTEQDVESLRVNRLIFDDPRYYSLLTQSAAQPGSFETTVVMDGADQWLTERRASATIDALPFLGSAYNIRTGLAYDEPARAGLGVVSLGLEVFVPAVRFGRGASLFVDDASRLATSSGSLRVTTNTGAVVNATQSAGNHIEVGTIHTNMATRQGSFSIKIRGNDPIGNLEINAAQVMTHRGYDVVLRTPVGTRAAGETSDLLLNGARAEIFAPVTNNVSRIVGAVFKKNSQLPGGGTIILDLRNTTLRRRKRCPAAEKVSDTVLVD